MIIIYACFIKISNDSTFNKPLIENKNNQTNNNNTNYTNNNEYNSNYNNETKNDNINLYDINYNVTNNNNFNSNINNAIIADIQKLNSNIPTQEEINNQTNK